MKTIDLEEVTREAVTAALDVIDNALDGTTKRGPGPCGDALAGKLHEIISQAIKEQFTTDYAPAFICLQE